MNRPRRPNRTLAALLAEADWTAADLARAVNALGPAHGLQLHYDRTSVAHWLKGSCPRPPVGELVAQALSRRTGRTLTPLDTGFAEPDAAHEAATALLQHDDPVQRLAAVCRADTDPTRRASLAHAVVAAPPIPDWAAPPPALPPVTPGIWQASATDATRLEAMAAHSALMAEKYGGAHGRPALAVYLSEDVVPLLTAPARPAVRNALLTGAAQLTLLLAARTADVGHLGLARHYHTTALALAHAAGDRGTYAITLRCLSVQAHRLGDHREALALAEAALDAAGTAVPHATRAFLHAGRAMVRAGAGAGQDRAAVADLTTADGHLERASGPEGPFTSYPETALRYQRAEVLSQLGDHKGAAAELTASLAGRPGDHHKARTLLHARLAHTLLALHDVEAAVAHGRHVLRHHRELAAGSVPTTLPELLQRLAPYRRNPHVEAFRERLRATLP